LQTLNIQGGNMRYILSVLSAIVIINGCKKTDNGVNPVTESPLSVSKVLNTNLYTFSINKDIYGTNDTIAASLTAENIGTVSDTILISCMGMGWTLTNAYGVVVKHSLDSLICNSVREEILAPHQIVLVDAISLPVNDTTLVGSYVLSTRYLSSGLSLNLIVR
jgi:hypothetical protein